MAWCIGTLEVGFAISNLIVKVEEGNAERGVFVISDHSGCISARVQPDSPFIQLFVLGKVIEIGGTCLRDGQGRISVQVQHAEQTEDSVEAVLIETESTQALVNFSTWHRYYGLIVIRKDKCLLARNRGVWEGLTFATTVGEQEESEKCAALASIEEMLDIDAEEVFMLPTVNPVTVYSPTCAQQHSNSIATFYIAYANHPPPQDDQSESQGGVEGVTTGVNANEEFYEWVTYEDALRLLQGTPEKDALVQAAVNLNVAVAHGFCKHSFGVPFAENALQLNVDKTKLPPVCAAPEPIETLAAHGATGAKIGVTLLSGFLGAGKTTLLEHLLTEEHSNMPSRMAVIVNDMSEINVDFSKIKLVHREEEMVEMTNGCICCTLREDLLSELSKLYRSGRFDYVLIESTGISEPLPVAETFTFVDEITGRALSDIAKLDTLVTVVDASSFLHDFQNEAKAGDGAKHLSELLVDQIEFANVILLNKIDLVEEKTLVALERLVRKLNPSAKVIQCEKGRVSASEIVGTESFSMEEAHRNPGWLKELRGQHVPETEEYGISSFVYRSNKPFQLERLRAALKGDSMGQLVRSKGIVWVATIQGWHQCVEWSHAGHRFELTYGQEWLAALPKEEWPEGIEEAIGSKWTEEYGDRGQEVVLIGLTLDRERIEGVLNDCLCTDQELQAATWQNEPWPESSRNNTLIDI